MLDATEITVPTISFIYTNHKGNKRRRTITVDSIEFHRKPGYGYQPGWFVSGIDMEKRLRRSFALSHIEVEDSLTNIFKLLDLSIL